MKLVLGLFFDPEDGSSTSPPKKSVNVYQTTYNHIPEDSIFHVKTYTVIYTSWNSRVSVAAKTNFTYRKLHVTFLKNVG
jgi:hypothetical protein